MILWGHYRLTADLLERLEGRLHDQWITAATMNMLGSCYRNLGQFSRAIGCHQQALAARRELGDHRSESVAPNSLEACYWPLGHLGLAADLYRQALVLAREAGTRNLECAALVGLGLCHEYPGRLTEAIERHMEALRIARDIGDRNAEATIVHRQDGRGRREVATRSPGGRPRRRR